MKDESLYTILGRTYDKVSHFSQMYFAGFLLLFLLFLQLGLQRFISIIKFIFYYRKQSKRILRYLSLKVLNINKNT